MTKRTDQISPSPPDNPRRTRSKGSAKMGHTLSQVEHQTRELKKHQRTLPDAKDIKDQLGNEQSGHQWHPRAWPQLTYIVLRTKEAKEGSKEVDDHLEGHLQVPKSVLDGCLASFTAADETQTKGSTQFFDVTANMTLLCPHDCPLFSMNMTTAGEGQHYVLVLLGKLFEHLPPDFFVCLLYDIGCQLHRSCDKWGFLKSYMNHMTFVVSIFHAFGNQWPCQIVSNVLGMGYAMAKGWNIFGISVVPAGARLRSPGYGSKAPARARQKSEPGPSPQEGPAQAGAQALKRHVLRLGSKTAGFGGSTALSRSRHITIWHALSHLIAHGCVAGYYVRMFNLDIQFEFNDKPNLFKLEDMLCHKWEAQVKAQTKLLPCQRKNEAKSTVEEAIQLHNWDAVKAHVDELRRRIINVLCELWEIAMAELVLEAALNVLTKARAKELWHLLKRPFLTKKMNACALNTCIREPHAKAYQTEKAPRISVAPLKIEMEGLFDLDVDNNIWLDIGLGYEEEDETVHPLWLSNDMVRKAIHALLDRDRCHEDWVRILAERNTMEEWFNKEWRVVHASMDKGKSTSLLKFSHSNIWERSIVGVPNSDNLPELGPSEEDICMYQVVHVLGSGVEAAEDMGFDYHVEFKQEADGLLVEHLDSLAISENY
ncbi:hypothetical protein BDP27DRAFT_1362776 [Rhodocollybia butyracea]|uniref:Uncharacterized protein n=1 Tax=Rhodocollybia butyracea TaxID=206335 RepID=A0A9P5PVK2_9AGAR|nr:hypothetical protein BDP27DRAFT_1362776 [Rhodocollybia butyracea]